MNESSSPKPRFLTPPPPASMKNSPELRRLVLFGALALLALVLTFMAKSCADAKSEARADAAAPVQVPVETPEERQKRVQSLFGGALERMTDGTDFDQSVAYLDVIREVSQTSEDNFHARVTKRLDWAQAVNMPATVRGDFVRVRGLAAQLDPVKLMQPAGTVEDVYRCFVSQPDGSEVVAVDLVVRPRQHVEVAKDVVDVEGVVLRTVKYESKHGKFVEVPYLVGKTIDVYSSPPTGPQGVTKWLLLGTVVVGGLLIARMLFKSSPVLQRHGDPTVRKPGVGIRELFEMRLREDELARKNAAPPSTPDPKKP